MRGVWPVRLLLLTCLFSAAYGGYTASSDGWLGSEKAAPSDEAFGPKTTDEATETDESADTESDRFYAPVAEAKAPEDNGGETGAHPAFFLTGGLLGMGLVFFSGMVFEFMRVILLVALVAPMLARKGHHRGDDLTKGRVLGFIEANAGIHFSALRDGLGLANGVTAYHTNNLEREGKIFSWKAGKNRRYASSFVSQTERWRFQNPLTGTRLAVLEVLAEKGQLGTTTRELRERLEISRQLLSHHLNELKGKELIESTGKGTRAWRTSSAGLQRLQVSKSLQEIE